jgi:hypothetical protein
LVAGQGVEVTVGAGRAVADGASVVLVTPPQASPAQARAHMTAKKERMLRIRTYV